MRRGACGCRSVPPLSCFPPAPLHPSLPGRPSDAAVKPSRGAGGQRRAPSQAGPSVGAATQQDSWTCCPQVGEKGALPVTPRLVVNTLLMGCEVSEQGLPHPAPTLGCQEVGPGWRPGKAGVAGRAGSKGPFLSALRGSLGRSKAPCLAGLGSALSRGYGRHIEAELRGSDGTPGWTPVAPLWDHQGQPGPFTPLVTCSCWQRWSHETAVCSPW